MNKALQASSLRATPKEMSAMRAVKAANQGHAPTPQTKNTGGPRKKTRALPNLGKCGAANKQNNAKPTYAINAQVMTRLFMPPNDS